MQTKSKSYNKELRWGIVARDCTHRVTFEPMCRPTASQDLVFCFWLCARAAVSEGAQGGYNVRDFGAVADDKTIDTASIQKAIDTAAAAGGGEVVLPAGSYRTGSIELKSHVSLRLEAGAVIHGSAAAEDYPLVTARWEGIERECHQALIFAHNAEDIAISGSGGIVGEGKVGKLRDPRGPTLIEPSNCKNVRLSGVTIGNIGVWTLHPTYCQGVTVSNVTFDSKGKNSDGMDPDSCQAVVIDHCTFSAGDDDIAIKSGKGEEGVKIGDCRRRTSASLTALLRRDTRAWRWAANSPAEYRG